MEFRQIRYLLEIVRGGGFTRAAENLGIAQPSLSVAVQKLEDELGVTLLNRQERKITLTAEGRAFLPRAAQIEELVRGAVHEMEEFRGLERGEIRVGIPGMLGTHFFPALIAEFRQSYPNLKLSVYSDGANRIQALVESGDLDAGIVAAGVFPDSLVSRSLIREEMVACVARGHALAGRDAITLEEMAQEPLFLFSEGYFQRQYLGEAMARTGITPNVVFETNLVPLLKEVTARGGGVTTLLRMAVKEPELVAVPFAPPMYVEAVVVWKKHAYLSKATRAFLDFLEGKQSGVGFAGEGGVAS
ncbi:LysR family transcriptional regulator [Geomesophilobacter sediminis]|uniref:LysR family transcriptional regulator n=1 Tax=Geomesophilobacter sediminis TaxID=2798584 RepID=A0A8J7LYJ5_9BACT|nr:LysR family transcriptional regulator [Geomesophilobacter sediminis]MBJ6724912.1 LysR family transcriptional regulator [Geomesophilobacter sediminis]